jgi:hypothetical protein
MTIAVLFVIACISNLVQLQLHQMLAQPIWESEQRKVFRKRLNVLRIISWHGLLTSIVLTLCILPYPWIWACYGVNFCYGLMLYRYYFLKPRSDFPSFGGEVVSAGAIPAKNAEAAAGPPVIRSEELKVKHVIPERLRNHEAILQKQRLQSEARTEPPKRKNSSTAAWAAMLLISVALFYSATPRSQD